jgi:hypothetical protein
MFEADFSDATVLALFLLPTNLARLQPKFLAMKPGTRIVTNTFALTGWTPDAVTTTPQCNAAVWCTALLWIVPAKVEGTWTLPEGELTFTQEFQMVSGSLKTKSATSAVTHGRLQGDQISFTVGKDQYIGTVRGETIEGTVLRADLRATPWKAQRR